MTPYDLRSLAQLLLKPAQFRMWEAQWTQGLQGLLHTSAAHENAVMQALMLDHLMGMGQHTNPVAQARDTPQEALKAIQEEAKKVFLKIPAGQAPQKAFTNITGASGTLHAFY